MFTNYQIAEFCVYRYAMTSDLDYIELKTFYFGMRNRISKVMGRILTNDDIIMITLNTVTVLKKLDKIKED